MSPETFSALIRKADPVAVRRLGRSLGVDCDGLDDQQAMGAVVRAAYRDSIEGIRERAREEREQRREFSVQLDWSKLMQEMAG